jgi:hypothetical protein
MPRLPSQRSGTFLEIGQQEVKLSRWPVRKKGNSYTPQTEILTKNPWEAIEGAINVQADRRTKHTDICLSFLYQSMDFYRAQETSRVASRPLLLYYSLLNLAKALIVHRNIATDLEKAVHGLTENRGEYTKAVVTAQPVNPTRQSIFDLFSRALGNQPITAARNYHLLADLLPQIVIGHRLWAQAANKRERFIRADQIRFLHDQGNRQVWFIVDLRRSDLSEIASTAPKVLKHSGLDNFHQVSPTSTDEAESRHLKAIVRLEQKTPATYTNRPVEALHNLQTVFGRRLWCIMRTVPPYRRYYLWGSPEGLQNLVDPLLSIYMVVFYLGPVTRYRPHYFEDLQVSKFGNLFDEILQTQRQQMLFHLAAEFQRRDVSWPAVL